MKNLKKVLSLALAFAMVLGLCVTGMAAEDVTTAADWDSVTDKDSALLLNAFEIMEGSDEDGVLMFNPENNVTRAEAAALISRALWGGNDNPGLYANGNAGAYIDVVTGAWYMGYVNFMTVKEIMVGDGDGEFRPDGNVTGYELLKMCLVAVGYDAETEKLTGAGWDLRTMALATQRGFQDLTAGTTVTDWNAPLSRMNAATIVANMIYREMVAYDDGKVVVITYDHDGDGGSIVPPPTPEIAQNFGVGILGMTQITGWLLANEYGNDGSTTSTIETDADNYAGENAIVQVGGNEIEVVLNSSLENVGESVTLYYVDYGTPTQQLVSVSVNEPVEMTPSFNRAGDFTNEDETWADGTDRDVIYQYNVDTVTYGGNLDTDTGNVMSFHPVYGWSVASNGAVKFYDTDGTGRIDTVKAYKYNNITEIKEVVETETFGTLYQVGDIVWRSSYDRENYVLGNNFFKADDCSFTAEKGDFVAYFTVDNVFGDTVYNGYVLEPVEGKINRINGTTGAVSIDGVAYGTTISLNVGDEGTFYLYENGRIAHFEGVSTWVAPTYAMIYKMGVIEVAASGINAGSASLEVAATLEDGTTGTYIVEKIENTVTNDPDDADDDVKTTYTLSLNNDVDKGNDDIFDFVSKTTNGVTTEIDVLDSLFAGVVAGTDDKLVQYTINEENGKMTLHLTDGATVAFNDSIASGEKVENGNEKVDDLYLLEKGVTFVKTTPNGVETWTAYTGTTVPSIDLTGAANVITGDRYTEGDGLGIKYMVVSSSTATTGPAGFLYVISNSDDIGDDKFETVVYNGSTNEVETVTHKGSAAAAGDMFASVSANGGFSSPIAEADKGNIVVAQGKDIVVQSAVTGRNIVYTTDNDTKYFLIDGEDSTEIALADISVQAQVSDTTPATWQTVVVANANDDVIYVIIYAEEQQ